MAFTIVLAYDRPEIVGKLFNEYTRYLIRLDPGFQAYLDIQHYDEELRHLENKYGLPGGRLYLALTENGEPAGCVAMTPAGPDCGELKRLYVRPAFQGQGLGRLLTERILQEARLCDYSAVRLDTLPPLRAAIHIYRSMGFYEIEAYNENPMGVSIYMKKDL